MRGHWPQEGEGWTNGKRGWRPAVQSEAGTEDCSVVVKAEQQTEAALAVSCHLERVRGHSGHNKKSETLKGEVLALCGEQWTQCDIISEASD